MRRKSLLLNVPVVACAGLLAECCLIACAFSAAPICNSKQEQEPGTHECGGSTQKCENIYNKGECNGGQRVYPDTTISWNCEDAYEAPIYCGPESQKKKCWKRYQCTWDPMAVPQCQKTGSPVDDFDDYPVYQTFNCI